MKYIIFLNMIISTYAFASEISFKKDVQPILKSRCSKCHNDNTPLPNFAKYSVAYKYRFEIKKKVTERTMPHFGDMRESERDLIRTWVNEGAKK